MNILLIEDTESIIKGLSYSFKINNYNLYLDFNLNNKY